MQPYSCDPIEIVLKGGKTVHICFSVGSVRRLRKLENLMPVEVAAAAIHEGLIDSERQGLDYDAICDLIDLRAVPYINERIKEAMGQSSPEASGDPTQASPAAS